MNSRLNYLSFIMPDFLEYLVTTQTDRLFKDIVKTIVPEALTRIIRQLDVKMKELDRFAMKVTYHMRNDFRKRITYGKPENSALPTHVFGASGPKNEWEEAILDIQLDEFRQKYQELHFAEFPADRPKPIPAKIKGVPIVNPILEMGPEDYQDENSQVLVAPFDHTVQGLAKILAGWGSKFDSPRDIILQKSFKIRTKALDLKVDTLEKMADIDTAQGDATRALIELTRILKFLVTSIRSNLDSEKELSVSLIESYALTLKKHHGIIFQTVFQVLFILILACIKSSSFKEKIL